MAVSAASDSKWTFRSALFLVASGRIGSGRGEVRLNRRRPGRTRVAGRSLEEDLTVDFDDLDFDVSELRETTDRLENFVEVVSNGNRSRRRDLKTSISASARNAHWLQLQVFYDAGIRDFRHSNLLQIRGFNEDLPTNVTWRVVNVRRTSAASFVDKLFNLDVVEGVHDVEVLDALNASVSKNKRYQDGRRLKVSLALAQSSLESSLSICDAEIELIKYVKDKCPSLECIGFYVSDGSEDRLDEARGRSLREQLGQVMEVADGRKLEFAYFVQDADDVLRLEPILATGLSSLRLDIAGA
uniref:Uncharacterized protein n=1 Tax=Rhodosorus marinus TaxID=101924 RepID=A0A7S2ZNP5_9RHOD|mmetsp:Transcript_26635/g.103592  ORF Transcript_26635/g.103592 Transcript_26635/m.103592 type:complete len:299 (+) Transcript_26635:68-964(+)